MQPGYLHQQLPTEAPQQGEKWDTIMKDVEDKIVPGMLFMQLFACTGPCMMGHRDMSISETVHPIINHIITHGVSSFEFIMHLSRPCNEASAQLSSFPNTNPA